MPGTERVIAFSQLAVKGLNKIDAPLGIDLSLIGTGENSNKFVCPGL
jgi:hypothetical protein